MLPGGGAHEQAEVCAFRWPAAALLRHRRRSRGAQQPLRPAGPRRGGTRHGAPHAELAHRLQPAGADRHPPAGRHSDPRCPREENRVSDRGRFCRIAGVREIADRYRTWFVDAYGVLHDGSTAFPGVVDALVLAQRAGVTVVIVTNSGQRIDMVAKRLAGAGIAGDLYNHIMSSGELTWRHIEQLNGPELRRLFLLHPGGGPLWLKDLRNPIVDDVAL